MRSVYFLFFYMQRALTNTDNGPGSQYVLYQKPYAATERSLKLLMSNKVTDIKKTKAASPLWPLGIITYYIDSSSYDEIIAERIRSVMTLIENDSCVQFNSATSKPDNITWLHITNPKREKNCAHRIKTVEEGETVVVLGYGCLEEKKIMHTLLHAIGLKDEVTHPQRDRYIRVLWQNIQPEYRQLFQIQPQSSSKTLVEYDPLSVMHFHDRAFSNNGQATIIPLVPGLKVNPSDQLSQLDIMKLRLLFEPECNKRKVSKLIDSCKNVFHSNAKNQLYGIVKEENDNTSDENESSKEPSKEEDQDSDNIGNDKLADSGIDENKQSSTEENSDLQSDHAEFNNIDKNSESMSDENSNVNTKSNNMLHLIKKTNKESEQDSENGNSLHLKPIQSSSDSV